MILFPLQTTICAKSKNRCDKFDNMMFDIGVKRGCSLPPTLPGLYIDELETSFVRD